MWIVRLALRRPYTFVVMSVLIAVLGGIAIFTMPTDIFPGYQHPRGQHGVELSGRLARRDGEAHCHHQRTFVSPPRLMTLSTSNRNPIMASLSYASTFTPSRK